MTQAARQADAVIQELWRIKDASFEAAGCDPRRFLQQLREKNAELRSAVENAANSNATNAQPNPKNSSQRLA